MFVEAGMFSRDFWLILFVFLWHVPSKSIKTRNYILTPQALTEMSYLIYLLNVMIFSSSQVDVLD